MGKLHEEHRGLLILNIALLFLVVVEPYQLTTIGKVAGTTLYAIIIGTTLTIMAILNHYIVKENEGRGPEPQQFRVRRNSLIACGLIFYASIAIGYAATPEIEHVIWLIILLITITISALPTRTHASRSH